MQVDVAVTPYYYERVWGWLPKERGSTKLYFKSFSYYYCYSPEFFDASYNDICTPKEDNLI
jgi:hypothetical protein